MIGGRNMLGAGVDPRLFSYDFSGAYRIGENYAKGIAGLSESISKGIEGYQEVKKENSALTGQIKGIEKQIDSAINLFPEMTSQLEQAKISINDPDRPLRERAAEASTYGDYISNTLNMMKTQTQLGIARQREARMAASSGGGGGSSGGVATGAAFSYLD